MPHIQSYRLPDGRYTTDGAEYAAAWVTLGRKAEQFFPGYRVTGWDPMIRMVSTARVYTPGFDLTPEAVVALCAPADAN